MTIVQKSVNLDYEGIKEVRERLVALAQSLTDDARYLNDATRVTELEHVTQRLRNDRLRILVVGEFKRGKSTLINALLGEKVLPAWATPTTAIVSEVTWGEEPRAFLYHLSAPSDPIPVDVKDLASFVTIDEFDESAENPYQRAVVEWPLELCRNGVEVADSPGLNESPIREQVTLDYMQNADVLCFVFDCTAALSISERSFLESRALLVGASDIFFVGNKINHVEEEDERQRLKRSVQRRLADLLGTDPQLLFVNAKGALNARVRGDTLALGDTGLPELEHSLEAYLSEEPGRRRLAGTARLIEASASDLRDLAVTRAKMLAVDRDELQRRFEEQAEPLRALERQRDLILTKVENCLIETEREVVKRTTAALAKIADDVPGWAEEFTPKGRVTVNLFKMKKDLDSLVAEIVEHLSSAIQVEFAGWYASEIIPLVETRLMDLQEQVGQSIDEFMAEVDQVRFDLTLSSTVKIDALGAQSSGTERILAATAGFFVSGAGGVIEGSMFGWKGMVSSILPSLAAVIGLSLLNFGPWAIITSLVGLGFLRGAAKLGKANKKIKQDVAAEVSSSLRSSAVSRAGELGERVRSHLNDVSDALHQALEASIQDLHREVDHALGVHETSEREVARRDEELVDLTRRLEAALREARGVFDGIARI